MNLRDLRGLKYPDDFVIRFFFKEGLHRTPGRVLELGSGNGNNLQLFSAYGWDVTGIDVDPAVIDDAEHNFGTVLEPGAGWRFVRHDLCAGLPQLPGPFDAVLMANVLYYVSRAKAKICLAETRAMLKTGAHYFARIRTLGDHRYGRGREVEPNGFLLSTAETGEEGLLNVFYHQHEFVDLLQEGLGARPEGLVALRADFDNWQGGRLVSNRDLVFWGTT